MRCISCGVFYFRILCKACEDDIKPHLGKRKLKNDFYVYSFFGYNEIAPLLHTKHHHCGAYIYKILAKKAFGRFLDELDLPFLNIIPIDDRTKGAYSHTAVLANAIKSKKIKPHYGSLRARNRVSYSGKSLRYRKANPRDFECKISALENVIFLDDLITTGTTLFEALKVAKKSNIHPLFALTLADAKVK